MQYWRETAYCRNALECSAGDWRLSDFGIIAFVIDRRFMSNGARSAASDSFTSRFMVRSSGTQFAFCSRTAASHRISWRRNIMDSLLRDIRFGVRVLSRDRGFTLTALITLAACLSVNTVVFAIVHSVLLKPLPVADADRLVLMSNQYPKMGWRDFTFAPDYYDRLQQVTVLSDQAAFFPTYVNIEIDGLSTRFDAMEVTPSLFRLL